MKSTWEELYETSHLEPADVCNFRSGKQALDDYFRRHALPNDQTGIGRTYVLRRSPTDETTLPQVLGFYTLTMSLVESAAVAEVMGKRLPRYPLPVALIGRLAVDERVQGRRLGERLLLDALWRIVNASEILGCIGVIVDAKDEGAAKFYKKYDFVMIQTEGWPRRMFLPLQTVRAAFARQPGDQEEA